MFINWLDIRGILVDTFILPNFLRKIRICYFKVKHSFWHVSGIVGPIDMKRRGGASFGYWVDHATSTFDLNPDIDLWFFKVKFQNSCIAGIVICLMLNKNKAYQLDKK